MHPPGWACYALYNLHRHARLAWQASRKTDPDSLNVGKFVLVQLYHIKDASKTYLEPWYLFPGITGESAEYLRIIDHGKGPVFSKHGRPCRDWDPLFRVPVCVAHFEPQEVFSGSFLSKVKEWIRPIQTRIYISAKEAGFELEKQMSDVCGEAGNELYRMGQRPGGGMGAPIVAKKFIKPSERQLALEAGEYDLRNRLIPPAPKGGWEKYLEPGL